MSDSRPLHATGRAILVVALVSLALLARLFGPAGSLPVREGYAAICTGSEIVYVPLKDLGLGGPPPDKSPAGPGSDPCPWFASFHALDPVGAFVPAPPFRLVTTAARGPDRLAAPPAFPAPFHARAPPPVLAG